MYNQYIKQEKEFEKIIKEVIALYILKRQAGVIPSYTSLLNRCEKLWFSQKPDFLYTAYAWKDEKKLINIIYNNCKTNFLTVNELFENNSINHAAGLLLMLVNNWNSVSYQIRR